MEVGGAVQVLDLMLYDWNDMYGYLEHAEALYEASGCTKRPKHRTQLYGFWGASASLVSFVHFAACTSTATSALVLLY